MQIIHFTDRGYERILCPGGLSFKNKGIYLITGANGSGKTALMRSLVFGNNDVRFESDRQRAAYQENRNSLFAYVPQQIPAFDIPIYKYLGMESAAERNEAVYDLAGRLAFDISLFSSRLDAVSGGERMKCALIRAFLKQTPYIFLDEPTNHMDDGTAKRLTALLEEKACSCTVVIITHDPRVRFENCSRICVDNFCVRETENGGLPNTEQPAASGKPEIAGFSGKLVAGKYRRLCVLMTVLFILAAFMADYLVLAGFYAKSEETAPGRILAYNAEHILGELNRTYAKETGIDTEGIDPERNITLADIPDIADLTGVREVYILDETEAESILDEIAAYDDPKGREAYSAPEIALPVEITEDFADVSGYGNLFSLVHGTAPENNSHEIAMSAPIMEYCLPDTKAEDAVGQTVAVFGETCRISGITEYDFVWRSFEKETEGMYYRYDRNSYEEVKEKIAAEREAADYIDTQTMDHILILCDPAREEEVLAQLISRYPAANYASRVFGEKWDAAHNRKLMGILLAVNAAAAVLFGLWRRYVETKAASSERDRIRDFCESHIIANEKKVVLAFGAMQVLPDILSICIFLAVSMAAGSIAAPLAAAVGACSTGILLTRITGLAVSARQKTEA